MKLWTLDPCVGEVEEGVEELIASPLRWQVEQDADARAGTAAWMHGRGRAEWG
jgi:hypothetical protein